MQNRDGRVTKRDFRRVLESFCFRMSQQQFHELMAMIDPYNKGYVSYLEFLDRFEQRETKVIYSAVVFSKRPDVPALLNEISLPTLPPWRLILSTPPLKSRVKGKKQEELKFCFLRPISSLSEFIIYWEGDFPGSYPSILASAHDKLLALQEKFLPEAILFEL